MCALAKINFDTKTQNDEQECERSTSGLLDFLTDNIYEYDFQAQLSFQRSINATTDPKFTSAVMQQSMLRTAEIH